MKKHRFILFIIIIMISLSACNDANKELDNDSLINDDQISTLADSLAITHATLGKIKSSYENNNNINLTDYQLSDNNITLTFTTDINAIDKIKTEVDTVLMEISDHTVDSKKITDGYATVYDHYNVTISVQDPAGDNLLTGEMTQNSQEISWE